MEIKIYTFTFMLVRSFGFEFIIYSPSLNPPFVASIQIFCFKLRIDFRKNFKKSGIIQFESHWRNKKEWKK